MKRGRRKVAQTLVTSRKVAATLRLVASRIGRVALPWRRRRRRKRRGKRRRRRRRECGKAKTKRGRAGGRRAEAKEEEEEEEEEKEPLLQFFSRPARAALIGKNPLKEMPRAD